MFSSEIHSRTQDKRETRQLSGLQVHVTRSTQVMGRALPSNLKWRPISSQTYTFEFSLSISLCHSCLFSPSLPKAMCFFSMFLVTFFSPSLRGARKKTKCPKKKNALAQCSRPPDRQMTHLAHCVERSHFFFFFIFFLFFPNDDKVKQLPVATVGCHT